MSVFNKSLIDLALKLPGGKIGVIGDLVCDHSIFGRTKRVSREAPVLILEHEKDHITMGGAANAIHNMATLDTKPFPIGLVGDDDSGKKLTAIIREKGVRTLNIFTDKERSTTVKTRVLGSGLHTTYQQMLRIDKGITDPILGKTEKNVLAALDILVDQCDALVVSDYGYGLISDKVLEKINAIAAGNRIPVLVDSRYKLSKFQNATLMTPNEPEAEHATGLKIRDDKDVAKAAKALLKMTNAKNICITRGKKGMYLKQENTPGIILPIFGSDEIADVTGAGDTVMATFAACIVAGINLYDAARLATVAGGLVVMKSGTATICVDEIVKALEEYNDE